MYACVLMPLAYRLLWRPGGVRAGVAGLNLPLQGLGTAILSLTRTSLLNHRCFSSPETFFLNCFILFKEYSLKAPNMPDKVLCQATQHSQPFLSV